jgi:hypothetical protein
LGTGTGRLKAKIFNGFLFFIFITFESFFYICINLKHIIMENNDNMVLSGEAVGIEYQIPELVDLNGIGVAMGDIPTGCSSGTNPAAGICFVGAGIIDP